MLHYHTKILSAAFDLAPPFQNNEILPWFLSPSFFYDVPLHWHHSARQKIMENLKFWFYVSAFPIISVWIALEEQSTILPYWLKKNRSDPGCRSNFAWIRVRKNPTKPTGSESATPWLKQWQRGNRERRTALRMYMYEQYARGIQEKRTKMKENLTDDANAYVLSVTKCSTFPSIWRNFLSHRALH